MSEIDKALKANFDESGKVVSIIAPTSEYGKLTLETIQSLLKQGGGIYVSATRPASLVFNELQKAKTDYDDL